MKDFEEEISKLADKAAGTHDSADALRFSQAALNLANAAQTQVFTESNRKENK